LEKILRGNKSNFLLIKHDKRKTPLYPIFTDELMIFVIKMILMIYYFVLILIILMIKTTLLMYYFVIIHDTDHLKFSDESKCFLAFWYTF